MVTCVANPETRHRRSSSGFRRITVALFCAGVATFGILYAVQALLPSLSSAFHLSPAAASLSVSVATCALAVGVLPLTAVSETLGRTPVMAVSLSISAGLGLLIAVSPNFTVLLVLRALQGLALAGIQAVAMSYLAEELHRDCLGFAMGLYIAGSGFGGMTGRLVAGLVDDVAGWRWALAAVGVLALACTIGFHWTIVPSAGFQPRPPRVRQLAASIGRAFTDTRLVGLFAVGFLLMGCFVTVYNYLGFRLLGPGFGLSRTVVGLIFVVYLAGSLSSAFAGRLADRFGRPQVLWIMSIITLSGLLLLAMGSLRAVIAGLVITTGGFFAAHSVAAGWVSARSETLGVQGAAVYTFCYYLGSSVGGTVGGLVFSAASWPGVTAYTSALILSVLFIAILLRRPSSAARMFRNRRSARLSLHAIAAAPGRSGRRLWRRGPRLCADRLEVLARQQEGLRRVATLVARGSSQSEVFLAVAEEMAHCLNVENADVFRYQDNGATIVVVGAFAEPGVPDHAMAERLTTEGDNISSKVWRTKQAARMDNWECAEGTIAERVRTLGMRSRVGAPIIVNERVWGMAVVGNSQPEPLPPDTEGRVAEFADLAATAIAAAATRTELIASRARIAAVADDARRRIERDLHDGAQQRLVTLGLKVRSAMDRVPAGLDGLNAELSDVASGLTAVLEELREISHGIHPAILSSGGLGAALKALARRSAVPVTVDVAIDADLPDSVEVAAYYVAAEALANAAKHAHATEVVVRARTVEGYLHLSIRDDGIGGADSRAGSGIIGLKDRIDVLGGKMTLNSPVGSGTVIDVIIPLAMVPNESHESC